LLITTSGAAGLAVPAVVVRLIVLGEIPMAGGVVDVLIASSTTKVSGTTPETLDETGIRAVWVPTASPEILLVTLRTAGTVV
jgi:hypothetical protein